MSPSMRLDHAIVERGLADTRSRAKALIMAGDVLVNDQKETRAGRNIAENDVISTIAQLGPEIRKDISLTSGYSDLAVYINYAHGDEPIESIYGRDKLPRLVDLKRKWDPHNIFSFSHALPMKYPGSK